jgi:hypothetical protein
VGSCPFGPPFSAPDDGQATCASTDVGRRGGAQGGKGGRPARRSAANRVGERERTRVGRVPNTQASQSTQEVVDRGCKQGTHTVVCASRIRTIAKLKRDAESGTEGKRRVGRRRKKKHLLCHTGVPRRVRRPVTHTPPSPEKNARLYPPQVLPHLSRLLRCRLCGGPGGGRPHLHGVLSKEKTGTHFLHTGPPRLSHSNLLSLSIPTGLWPGRGGPRHRRAVRVAHVRWGWGKLKRESARALSQGCFSFRSLDPGPLSPLPPRHLSSHRTKTPPTPPASAAPPTPSSKTG